MARHFNRFLFSALIVSLLGRPDAAFAASDEDKAIENCEQSLSAVPAVQFRLTDISPSRVRIMPVGRHVRPHETRNGAVFGAVSRPGNLQIVAGESDEVLVHSIPFATWDGLQPAWALDEDFDSILVAVSEAKELFVHYPFTPGRAPLRLALQMSEPMNAQAVRDRDGRVLILIPRGSGGADVFALKSGALVPVAIGPSTTPFLYEGLGDRAWLAWSEKGDESLVVVKTAVFEGLTNPALSFTLDPEETVTEFGYERLSESSGQLIVVTNRRTLKFSSQSQ